MMEKHRDILLIGGLLLIALALLAYTHFAGKQGGEAVVRVDGEIVARFSLTAPGDYVLNNGTNTLRIQDGTARMLDAACPDRLCVRQGAVSKTNQTIICLPNRLTVTIEGGQNGEIPVG